MPWLGSKAACQALGGIPESTLRDRAKRGHVRSRPSPILLNRSEYWIEGEAPPGKVSTETVTKPQTPAPEPDGATELAQLLGVPQSAEEAPPAKQPPPKDSRVWSVASIWDVHVPEHDSLAWEATVTWLEDVQPNELIIGGDFLEFESCSRHGGVASPRALVDEARAGQGMLRKLRAALPSARFVYLGGNHEARLERVVVDKLPTFDGAITIPRILDLESFRVEWIPYGELYRPKHPSGAVSKLAYMHGVYSNKFHAAKHADVYGCCVRYGHVHAAQVYLRGRSVGDVFGGFSTPCLRTLDVDWMDGPSNWVHGAALDYVMPDGAFTANTIIMHDRRFVWAGKMYGRTP